MKNIGEILKNSSILDKNTDPSHSFAGWFEEEPIDEQTAKIVNYIFERFAGIIKAFKYSAECSVSINSIRREYTFALRKAKISDISNINRAIERLRDDKVIFLPSPGEFIEMCRPKPEDLGIPSVEKAYEQACRNSHPCETDKKWAHDAVRLAWSETGSFNLRTESKAKTFPIFAKNYKAACKEYAEGREMQRIENPRMTQEELQERKWRIDSGMETP